MDPMLQLRLKCSVLGSPTLYLEVLMDYAEARIELSVLCMLSMYSISLTPSLILAKFISKEKDNSDMSRRKRRLVKE